MEDGDRESRVTYWWKSGKTINYLRKLVKVENVSNEPVDTDKDIFRKNVKNVHLIFPLEDDML